MWNKITWYSQVVAVVLALGIFGVGFWLGRYSVQLGGPTVRLVSPAATSTELGESVVNDVTFSCDGSKTIRSIFHPHDVQLLLSDGRNLTVPQAISASGARYATQDESFVFWTKGDTAFITEGPATTYENCVLMPQPE